MILVNFEIRILYQTNRSERLGQSVSVVSAGICKRNARCVSIRLVCQSRTAEAGLEHSRFALCHRCIGMPEMDVYILPAFRIDTAVAVDMALSAVACVYGSGAWSVHCAEADTRIVG